jgi:ABC-type glycerol-3-phosphate transport system substrate-binding protein
VRARIATVAAALLATACGSTAAPSDTPWASTHPNPSGIRFVAAGGLCTITVRYPTEAPGEIDVNGTPYIQRDRSTPQVSADKPLAISADWKLYQPDQHTLLLLTPDAAFTFRDGANCGSNSAAPT